MTRLAIRMGRSAGAIVVLLLMVGGLVPGTDAWGGSGHDFELKVVGPDGKRVPGAEVEFRSDQPVQAGWVRKGTLMKPARYGSSLRTDGDGGLLVAFPKALSDLNLYITTPGFGPYWAGWSSQNHVEVLPTSFTAELAAGWSVGGVVVDEQGTPVEGVRVHPNIEFKKRPGVTSQLGSGKEVRTNARGRWRFDSVPVSMREVFVEVDHRAFRPVRRSLARGEFGIELGQEPVRKIVLDRGATVTGKVSDEAGKPVAGALVWARVFNEVREARTGADGVYRLEDCKAEVIRIGALAAGKGIEVRDARIKPDMEPVHFVLKGGRTVRLRVIDWQGKPVAKARVFFQQWRGRHAYFDFRHVNQYADANGLWVWNEAPWDEFTADIRGEGRMELVGQRLMARAEEYVFRLPELLVVSGRVIDRESKQPVQSFRVIPGVKWSPAQMNWEDSASFRSSDGRYEWREHRGGNGYFLRIEAEGYCGESSREIGCTEGKVTIDFALTRGRGLIGKVVTASNRPAEGAKVVLGTSGKRITIKNGDIEDAATNASREVTDKTGRFAFASQEKPFQLVITHPSGFALVQSQSTWDLTRIIHLEPWAKLEGRYREGTVAMVGLPVEIQYCFADSLGRHGVVLIAGETTTTGPGGRFVFERLMPGEGRIGRKLASSENSRAMDVGSSRSELVRLVGAKTCTLELGGNGRPVVGQLESPPGFVGKIRWDLATIQMFRANEDDGSGANFRASVDKTGRFRIVDVPTGNYDAQILLHDDQGPRLFQFLQITVPAMVDDRSDKPMDLGVVRMQRLKDASGNGGR